MIATLNKNVSRAISTKVEYIAYILHYNIYVSNNKRVKIAEITADYYVSMLMMVNTFNNIFKFTVKLFKRFVMSRMFNP